MPVCSCAQTSINIDSIVIKFLQTKSSTSAPILTKKREGKKEVISRNYFFESNKPITKDNVRINTYVFGSSDSHAPIFFMITAEQQGLEMVKIFESKTIGEAINDALKFVEPFQLTESQKAVIVNHLACTFINK